MVNNLYKVESINDNLNYDSKMLLNALILRNANPINSIPFVGKSDSNISELCEKTNIDLREDSFYIDGVLIDEKVQLNSLVDSLISSVENFSKKEDTTYHLNMVLDILKNRILPKLKDNILTVDDLVKSLYGVEDEKVGKGL